VPGQVKRTKRAVTIAGLQEMTKSEAERWLSRFIEVQGVNDPASLTLSQSPVPTFGSAATAWKERYLVSNKKPSSQRSMSCELTQNPGEAELLVS
jgi:hypothetical protein